jgi:type IV secretion system protein VirB1
VTLSLPAALALAAQCAPGVAPETLLSVAHTESKFDPLAIGVNGAKNPPPARNAVEAAAVARRYIAAGYSVDLGIAQINSRNLEWLALSVEDAFDPCRNLAAAARVLTANYAVASRRYAAGTALGVALSMYNTGDGARGYRNGYVGRVYRSAAFVVPAIAGAPSPTPIVLDSSIPSGSPLDPTLARTLDQQRAGAADGSEQDVRASSPIAASPPPSPSWDVFGAARQSSVMVFKGTGQ